MAPGNRHCLCFANQQFVSNLGLTMFKTDLYPGVTKILFKSHHLSPRNASSHYITKTLNNNTTAKSYIDEHQ